MHNCNICGSDDYVYEHRGEYLCVECNAEIEEALGELNEAEDAVCMDDEFWAQVVADELEEWKP